MDIVGFTAAILPIALSPGASFTMAVSNAVRDGFRGVAPVIVGTAAGIFVHATMAGLGVSRLFSNSSAAMGALKIGGTIYLLWLSFRMIGSGLSRATRNDLSVVRSVGIMEAAIANLLNVKPILLYLTVVPLFAGVDLSAYFLAASIHVSVMAVFLCFCGIFLATASRNVESGYAGAAFTIAPGVFLLVVTLKALW